jgi:hypothetical protein
MLLVCSSRRWQPFTSRQQSWIGSLLLRKMTPDTIHSTSADRSTGPYPVSLPSQPMKQCRKPHIYQQQATRLTGPISPTCDRYVQYLLTGPTGRSLIDIGRGYNLEGADFLRTTPRPSQLAASPFP